MTDNIPHWALQNRTKTEAIRNKLDVTYPQYIDGSHRTEIQIGSANLQEKINIAGIKTLEQLKTAFESGALFTSPKHKQIVKNYIEKREEEIRNEKLQAIMEEKKNNSK